MDPLNSMKAAVRAMEQQSKFSNMLVEVRSISESDEKTLARIIKERNGIAKIFDELGIKHDPFDYKYAYVDVVSVLRERLGLPKEKR